MAQQVLHVLCKKCVSSCISSSLLMLYHFRVKKKCASSWISSSLHMLYHFTSWTLKVVVTLPVFQSTKTWCLVVIIRTSSRLNTRGRGNGTCLKITHHCFKLHCVIESTKIKNINVENLMDEFMSMLFLFEQLMY